MKTIFNKESSVKELTDEQLIALYVQQRAPLPIEELYSRYAHLVMGVCMKYLKDVSEAQEATQQIFIKILDDLPRFEIQLFRAWIHQVARNHCLMSLRKSNKVVYHEDALLIADVESDDVLHRKLKDEQRYEELEQAIQGLSTEQRECLKLFYYEKKNYAEIATLKSLSLMKVKSAIQNGKRNLKIMLTRTNGIKR